MTAALAVLNPAALVTLADCEQRIERGLKTFIDVGQALAEIRDSRLYKGTHATFEDYCRDRWGFSRQRAQQFTAAADLATTIVDTGLPSPTNEGQARALAAVPEAERADVWRDVVESGDKPTAAAIRKAAEARQTPGPVDTTTSPADPGSTPAPAAGSTAESPVPSREPVPGLAQRVWDVLDQHGPRPYGMTVGEIWLKLDGVHSADIPAALTELAEQGRAVVMGHAQGVEPQELRARWLPRVASKTPEPAADLSAAQAGSGPDVAAAPGEGGAAAAPTLRLVPTEDEKRAAERRDARGLLLRAVEILAPAHDRAGFAKTWARQLGPYDAELSGLIRRATEAMTTLDELIEGCGQ